ncbi:MAG: phosphomannomutase/phosphoglucomutase [Candidatus Endobugula sp.]|jgi:phosphomannomutase/phosphoglucomutase
MKNKKKDHKLLTGSWVKPLAILVCIIAVFTAVMVYSLWRLVVVPENQQRFEKQIIEEIAVHRKKIDDYMLLLQTPLYDLANTIPVEIFERDHSVVNSSIEDMRIESKRLQLDSEKIDQWLLEHRMVWEKQLPYVKKLALFSVHDIAVLLASSPQKTDKTTANFLLIDMINRLQDGQPLFVEAAKIPGTSEWELHKIMPVRNNASTLIAVLHVTFSLQGLHDIFNDMDLSLAKISLSQFLGNNQGLTFFSIGKASNHYPQRTGTIMASHWQMTYRPSAQLFEKTKTIPNWLLAVVVIMPLLMFLLGIKYLSRTRVITNKILLKKPAMDLKQKTIAEKASEVLEEDHNKFPVLSDQPQGDKDKINLLLPDSIFRAYDIRGIAHEQFSQNLAQAIGQAVATEVLSAGDTAMIVAHDARSHSPEFSAAIIEGVISTGCDVIDIGLVPTPLMNFAACLHKKTSSGVIVTASHNPKEYNGCKMVVKGETLVDTDIQRIKARIRNNDVISATIQGSVSKENFAQAYIDRVVGDVAVVDGWRVVVDAGNGAASELAPSLFNALHCDTTCLYCEFDGEFPNHDPDPSVVENLVALVKAVKQQKADIGFAFDGDADRLMVVTASGKILWPDQLLMLFAQDVVARNPGCDVIFDVKSTQLLPQVISENGGRPIMCKTGHSHIKAKMRETQALLGGEFSGHIFFKERWFGFDDGLYAAVRLLELMTLTGETVDGLLSRLPTMCSTAEIKIAVAEEQKFVLMERLINEANLGAGKDGGERTLIDGLRVDFEQGWGLVRASNTAPVLTLRFEAVNDSELNKLKKIFKRELYKIDNTLILEF